MPISKYFRFLLFAFVTTLLISCSSSSSQSIDLSLETVEFPEVNIGDFDTQELVISSKYNKVIVLKEVAITGSSEFKNVSTFPPPVIIEEKGTTTLKLQFTPISAGLRTGSISLTFDVLKNPIILDIKGTGVAVPKIELIQNSYDFGTIFVSETASQKVSISNNGSLDLEITSLTITGTGAQEFNITAGDTTPLYIAPGALHNITISFAPSTTATFDAELLIEHDAINALSPSRVVLQGKSIPKIPEIIPNQNISWDFGECSVTFTSTQSLELKSTGNTAVEITNISLQNSIEFQIIDFLDTAGTIVYLPVDLQVGEKLEIRIAFAPTAKQIFNDTLSITHTATNHNNPLEFQISGKGVDIRTKYFKYTGASQSWVVPKGVTEALVLVVGGGGGGSGSHYGGGGSGYSIVKKVDVSGTITIAIGNGGKGGVSGTNSSPGDDGETTKFGTLISADGGKGGGGGGAGYYTGGDGGSGGGGAGNMGYAGDGGSAGSDGKPGASYAGGKGGHFDSLTPFVGNLSAGKGGAAGVSSNSGGGGAGGVLFNGTGPIAGDGGEPWSGKGGEGYGAGGGSGGYDSGIRPGGGEGAPGFIYIEY